MSCFLDKPAARASPPARLCARRLSLLLAGTLASDVYVARFVQPKLETYTSVSRNLAARQDLIEERANALRAQLIAPSGELSRAGEGGCPECTVSGAVVPMDHELRPRLAAVDRAEHRWDTEWADRVTAMEAAARPADAERLAQFLASGSVARRVQDVQPRRDRNRGHTPRRGAPSAATGRRR